MSRLLLIAALLWAAAAEPAALKGLIPDSVDPQIDGTDGVEWIPAKELRARMARHQGAEGHRRAHREIEDQLIWSGGAAGAGAGAGVRSAGAVGGAPPTARAAAPASRADARPSATRGLGLGGMGEATAGGGGGGGGLPYSRVKVDALGPAERAALQDRAGQGGSGRRLQDDDEAAAPTASGPLFRTFEEDGEPDLSQTFAVPSTIPRPDNKRFIPVPTPDGCDVEAVAECGPELSACLGKDATDRGAACQCFREHGQCYRRTGCFELLPRADVAFCFSRFFCDNDACVGNGAGDLLRGPGAVALALLALAAAAAARDAGADGADALGA